MKVVNSGRARAMTCLLVSAAVMSACTSSTKETPEPPLSGPAIVTVAESGISYSYAEVRGRLDLQQGCFVINQDVAVWPAQTSWDAVHEHLTFGGDFRYSPPAPTQALFRGDGEVFDDLAAIRELLSEAGAKTLADCIDRTDASGIVFAHPVTSEIPQAVRRALTKMQSSIYDELRAMRQAQWSSTAVDTFAGVVRVFISRDVRIRSNRQLMDLLNDPRVLLKRAPAGTRPGGYDREPG